MAISYETIENEYKCQRGPRLCWDAGDKETETCNIMRHIWSQLSTKFYGTRQENLSFWLGKVESIEREAACSLTFQRAPKLTTFKTQSSDQQQHYDGVVRALLGLRIHIDNQNKDRDYFCWVQQQLTSSVRITGYQKEGHLIISLGDSNKFTLTTWIQ